ncbi:MAG TPA: hypothetical protein VGF30_11060 [Bacteroidia bacterium]
MKTKYWFILVIVGVVFQSCKRDCNEYINAVESKENGLLQEKEINGIIYSIQYQPVDYILYNEFKTCDLNVPAIQKRKEELGNLLYFELKIKAKDNTDVLMKNLDNKDQYYDRLNYCSFDMQDDFSVINGGDTVISSLYHFQNNYGLHSHVSFMLAFDKAKQATDVCKMYYKDYAFGNGAILFEFDKDKLEMNNE